MITVRAAGAYTYQCGSAASSLLGRGCGLALPAIDALDHACLCHTAVSHPHLQPICCLHVCMRLLFLVLVLLILFRQEKYCHERE